MECDHNYGQVTGYLMMPHYNYLMSDRVRMHLLKKGAAMVGISDPESYAKKTINMNPFRFNKDRKTHEIEMPFYCKSL